MMRALLSVIVCAIACAIGTPAPAAGQAPPPQTPPSTTAPPTPSPEMPPAPPPNYEYSPDGRRDPFMSLVNRGTADGRSGQSGRTRADGLAGIMVDEVVVRGIFQSRGGPIATIVAPNGKSYNARPGDRLMDGSVKSISGNTVILLQEVNDPLSLEKQREVKKYLRGEVK